MKGLYEPSHGSAPDIAGQGKANPVGSILSAAFMLQYSFGLAEEAAAVNAAVESALNDGHRTADLAPHSASEFSHYPAYDRHDPRAAVDRADAGCRHQRTPVAAAVVAIVADRCAHRRRHRHEHRHHRHPRPHLRLRHTTRRPHRHGRHAAEHALTLRREPGLRGLARRPLVQPWCRARSRARGCRLRERPHGLACARGLCGFLLALVVYRHIPARRGPCDAPPRLPAGRHRAGFLLRALRRRRAVRRALLHGLRPHQERLRRHRRCRHVLRQHRQDGGLRRLCALHCGDVPHRRRHRPHHGRGRVRRCAHRQARAGAALHLRSGVLHGRLRAAALWRRGSGWTRSSSSRWAPSPSSPRS